MINEYYSLIRIEISLSLRDADRDVGGRVTHGAVTEKAEPAPAEEGDEGIMNK
jgi:hypothetical protein